MKKSMLVLVLLLVVCIYAVPAQAVLGLGFGIRAGYVSNYKNPDVAGQFASQFSLPDKMQMLGLHVKIGAVPILKLEGSAEYLWKQRKFDYQGSTYTFRLNDLSLNGTAKYELPFPVVKPYAGAGLGFHRLIYTMQSSQVPYPLPLPNDQSRIGYHGLLGVSVHPPMFPAEFFGEWRYTIIPTAGANPHYTTLLIGATFGL